jgi:hypothetical protein
MFLEKIGDQIDFNAKDKHGPALFDKGCITCGRENLKTKFHGDRHVCTNCRRMIKSYDNDQIYLYLDEYGDIVCKGMKIVRD